MRPVTIRISLSILVLLLVGAPALAAPAATGGGLITGIDQSTGQPVALPDTGGAVQPTCPGDLAHSGRWFLRTSESRLLVTDATCAPATELYVAPPGWILRYARWSVDGTHIAFWAQHEPDADGDTGAGVYATTIAAHDETGRPIALASPWLVMALPETDAYNHPVVSWSGDSRFAYAVTEPDGTVRSDLFVVDATTGR